MRKSSQPSASPTPRTAGSTHGDHAIRAQLQARLPARMPALRDPFGAPGTAPLTASETVRKSVDTPDARAENTGRAGNFDNASASAPAFSWRETLRRSEVTLAAPTTEPVSTQAWRIHAFGGPDTLSLDEMTLAAPLAGEVIVRVEAAGINPVDAHIRHGHYALVAADRLPYPAGREFAGVIEAVNGAGCGLAAGDAVYGLLNIERGAHARHILAKIGEVTRRPGRISAIEAAALPLAALTAWQGLFDQGRLRAGQTVLIHGGSGGVGHLAVQLARLHGATVITTVAGGASGQALALGAHQAIDYHATPFERLCPKVDLVLDLVGGETQQRSWDVIREGGALISACEEPSEEEASRRHIRALRYTVHPSISQLDALRELVDAGKLTVNVGRVYPFAEAVHAQQRLEQGHLRGRLVLDMCA